MTEDLERLERTEASGDQVPPHGEHAPTMGERGWFPDETAIRRAEFRASTPGERVAEAISISRTATMIAAAGRRRGAR